MKKKSKFIEDEPAGVVYSKLNISLNDINSYRILYNCFKRTWRAPSWKKAFSPISFQIVDNLPLLSFVPAFLQLWTLCRFCELKQIRIQDIKKGADLAINSSKSDHCRSVPAVPFEADIDIRKIKDKTKIIVVSYDSYKQSIINVKNLLGLSFEENILDCTHIFRHLEASFLSKQGVPLSGISNKMGHLHDKTTLEYIHKDWRF